MCPSFTSRAAFTAAARLNGRTCHGTHSTARGLRTTGSSSLNAAARTGATPEARPCTQSVPRHLCFVFFFSEAAEKKSLKGKGGKSVHRTTSVRNRRGERSADFKERGTLSPGEDASSSRRNLPLETPGEVLPTRTGALFGAQKPSWCFQDDARLPARHPLPPPCPSPWVP